MREDRRHWFGQSATDWTMALGGSTTSGGVTTAPVLAEGPVTITLWTGKTGGAQITDLLDAGEAPITEVESGNGSVLPLGTIPQFLGPPDVTQLWADAGGSARYLLTATDLGDALADVATNTADISDLQTQVGALATVAVTGEYPDLIDKPVLAAVATSGLYSDLSGAPAPGLQYVLKTAGSWPVRSVSAPDTARPAVWIGAEPAPPAGGSYALEGDAWWPTP